MYKNSKFIFIAGVLFLGAILIGTQISMKSWNGMVYWYPESERQPAAIKKVFDFSHLEGGALKLASHKRLLADANVIETDDSFGIDLGHFVIKGPDNLRRFACDIYNKVELTFESADMSVNGEPSIMKVSADCKVNKDMNRIQTLWIPMKQILEQKEGDLELQLISKEKILFTFSNIGDRWPRAWMLSHIKMYSELNTSRFLEVQQEEMRSILERPLTLVWDRD